MAWVARNGTGDPEDATGLVQEAFEQFVSCVSAAYEKAGAGLTDEIHRIEERVRKTSATIAVDLPNPAMPALQPPESKTEIARSRLVETSLEPIYASAIAKAHAALEQQRSAKEQALAEENRDPQADSKPLPPPSQEKDITIDTIRSIVSDGVDGLLLGRLDHFLELGSGDMESACQLAVGSAAERLQEFITMVEHELESRHNWTYSHSALIDLSNQIQSKR
jgi:hypothetical protein